MLPSLNATHALGIAPMTNKKSIKNARNQSSVVPAAVVDQVKIPNVPFRIVGMGASAGGLEAFEQFFRSVPPDSGMAFVLVSHLDPSHDSILTEILQRTTAMPVVEVLNQMVVTPNCVYIIPPNRSMTISHRALQLNKLAQPRGLRMPIDAFLHSLAEDHGKNSIGIILSGTGADGTLGLRAILDAGGISLVQDPATSKYDGMPLSAIQAGNATYILPVEKMPERLLAEHLPLSAQDVVSVPSKGDGMISIIKMLRSVTGHDFSLYKKNTISRRIQRRMTQHHIGNTVAYANYLEENPDEVKLLFKELLIKVSCFFRDEEAFATLKRDILPFLFQGKPDGYIFRIWVTGCATGEETYSIAMVLREFMDETRQEFRVQIYSTDLDEDAIAVARTCIYSHNIAADVNPERLRRFFVKEETGYHVKKEIREMVIFASQTVIQLTQFRSPILRFGQHLFRQIILHLQIKKSSL